MRRMSMALVLAVAAGGLGASAMTAQAASAPLDGPPYAYKDCLKATADKGESPAQGKWHCNELVKKGWVKPPNR
ncbi:hypothetical protein [Streptomyces sp. NPDC017941]|uniref:hypothetical protein n=1 Tax=unclassified Streptomyces TaxID=2593676 RepID=UPI0037B4C776